MSRRWMSVVMLMCFYILGITAQTPRKDSLKIIYPEDSVEIMEATEPQYDVMDTRLMSSDDKTKLEKTIAKDRKKVSRDWKQWRPNPKRALWLALVLPGAGQIYNRKYWKLPIFYGGFVGCVYAMTWNNQMYRDYSQAYIDIMDNDPNTQSYNDFLHLGATVDESNKEYYQDVFKKRKDMYRRWRDLSIFATIGIYALSVIDAYVDASLSDFDISEDLSLHIAPTIINGNTSTGPNNPFKNTALGIGCSLSF
ncbi:hypothetical protein ETF27_06595 [Prevotella brunnea]|uniref:DUF5683 domain-containing protein n=2 Tax=Prevotellaceae TaxID=171552 RepID=A0A5C8GJ98_9BACT|nr:hypothetical protein [Prevotella brunnea]TXJ61919.1 hypothetical protein ETF27_06595 [Prevotella brunnea]